jgi:xanthine dehydrogenase accessory factor
VLDEDQARLVPYGISDEMAFNVGLACGGKIEVFIQPFGRAFPLEKPVAFAFEIDGPNQGQGLLAWEFGKHRGSLGHGDDFDAQVAQDAIQALADAQPRQFKYDGEGVRVFVDTYPAPPTIVLFGGVHIAVALTKLAKASGIFKVVIVDARGVWATPERFPDADEIHVMHAEDYLKDHQLGSNTYVAVLSHDPKLDDPALLGALPSKARYVGAIGSNKTQAERRERLANAGITEEQLARLNGPIGLDINAQTPEEIAVAILGQMIAAKNGKLARQRQLAPVAAAAG